MTSTNCIKCYYLCVAVLHKIFTWLELGRPNVVLAAHVPAYRVAPCPRQHLVPQPEDLPVRVPRRHALRTHRRPALPATGSALRLAGLALPGWGTSRLVPLERHHGRKPRPDSRRGIGHEPLKPTPASGQWKQTDVQRSLSEDRWRRYRQNTLTALDFGRVIIYLT